MPVYPGDPEVRIEPALRITAGELVNVLGVHMGSQTGTHLDAPYHILEDGARLDELPLERFLGPAVVADVRHLAPEAPVAWGDLAAAHDALGPGTILLLETGWARHWGDMARMRTHPWLAPDAARRIVEAGVRTVGIDALSIDATPEDPSSIRFDAHIAILGAGGVIVENLTGLRALSTLREPIVSVLPVALAHADGAPVRAVAFERAVPFERAALADR
jgi:kynurenine formamidase